MKQLRPVWIAAMLILAFTLSASAGCGDVSCPVAIPPEPVPIATGGEIPNGLVEVATEIIQDVLLLF